MLYTYDEEGNRVSVTDQNGHTTLTEYDALAEPVRVTQPLLQQTAYEYDKNGNLAVVTNAKGKKTTLAYDETDLLISRTDPLVSVTGYAYDALGRLVKVTDAEGNPTQNRYDALGRLVEVIDALNGHTTYEYDALGNLTAFTDANTHRTAFDVDLLGRTTGEHNPLGNTWQYQFDAAGNLIRRTDAKGVVTQHTYDADNRLTHTAYPSGPAVDLGYDANDNLINVTDGSGAAAFAYDALNRLTRMQRTAGILATKTLQYSYDAAGNRTGVTYPGGQAVSYAFNANNWLVTATDPIAGATQYTYDPVGLPVLEQNPNGTKTQYAYDDADRLLKLFNLKPQTSTDVISSFEYTLDKMGNRVQTIEKATSGQVITWKETYAYDKLYRLTKAAELPNYKSAQPYTSQFAYDAVGNRLSMITNIQDKPNTPPLAKPVTTNYTYNAANQMLAAGATKFTYDLNGNRVSMTGTTRAIDYRYDFENRLAGANTFDILNGGKRQKDSVLDFTYDGLGRRLERGVMDSDVRKTADFLYDGLGYDLLAQYVQPNNPNTILYFRDPSRMLSRLEMGSTNSQWYGYAHDGLDSVSGWTNVNGASVQEYKYAPYGRLIDNNGPDNTSNRTSPQNSVTFSGKLWDKESGTYYFGARDYDPATGTWLTHDPYPGRIAEAVTLNRYQYVKQNPINLIDAYGFDYETTAVPPIPVPVPTPQQPGSASSAYSSARSLVISDGTSAKALAKCLNGGTAIASVTSQATIGLMPLLKALFGPPVIKFGSEFNIPLTKVLNNADTIRRVSEQYGLDPAFVSAIILHEQQNRWYEARLYQQYAPAWFPGNDSIGLGQIRYGVWGEWLGYSREQLLKPETNIEAVARILMHETEYLKSKGVEPSLDAVATQYQCSSIDKCSRPDPDYGRQVVGLMESTPQLLLLRYDPRSFVPPPDMPDLEVKEAMPSASLR